MTTGDEVHDVSMTRPHVVILGAGASGAAFPHGDANGRRVPVMDTLVEVLGLEPYLRSLGIADPCGNFEQIYAQLYRDPDLHVPLKALEQRVRDYFSSLCLPETPTIYDHLLLSLRRKDLVASFNWDPFLMGAYVRNRVIGELPRLVFLHGCVAVGHCLQHWTKGPLHALCGECDQPFTPSRLFFPIDVKNYTSDEFNSREWETLKRDFKSAYMLTLFGYGAPASDVEAISLMKTAWGRVAERELEEIEIIDVKEEAQLRSTWSPFIHTHHYRTYKSFYHSWIPRHPRRTCEAMWNQMVEIQFLADRIIPFHLDLEGLRGWLRPLIEAEGDGMYAA